MPIKPEIMSPAGYWPQLHAAIEAGADAVYFGLKHFTARAKAGFTLDELPTALRTLHRRGVKGYVTFNTLVFDHELNEAARTLEHIAAAGADALIVQDVGIAQLAREAAPGVAVHGSTQMSITSAEGIALAQRFGVSRVVLARELSLKDIRAIREATDCELEIFVHGALCVSYSGQCFSSEAWGGRSANRGQCAQACRLPYEMIVDDRLLPLGDARYLLSPGDLVALDQIPEIVDIGIHSLKIEGRYKDEQYVALATDAYRRAVDAAWEQRPNPLTPQEALALEQVYSRGSGPYFLSGTNHQEVVTGRSPRHRGVLMGRVAQVGRDHVIIEPTSAQAVSPLKPGDGLVFDAADWRSPQLPEEGGHLYEVRPAGKRLELRFGNRAIDFERIRPGDWVWRSSDPAVEKAARAFTQPAAPVARQPLAVHVTAHEGEPLSMHWALVKHPEVAVTVADNEPLVKAHQRGATPATLRQQLDRLGTTAYELADLTADIAGEPFVPASLLNHLRQQAVEALASMQEEAPPHPHNETQSVEARHALPQPQNDTESIEARHALPQPQNDTESVEARHALPQPQNDTESVEARHALPPHTSPSFPPHVGTTSREKRNEGEVTPLSTQHSALSTFSLHLLVRTPEQLDAALELRPASITLDYLELYGLRPSVERILEAGLTARVASPRVLKPQEQRIVNFLLRLDCPLLVRSGGLLEALQGRHQHPLFGDFSLNAANALTAATWLALGIERLTPTHDLNAGQIAALAREIGGERLEVIAYQHLPVFHTEHCVFCRFLSTGTSYLDCGHPCEKHRVALKDAQGRAHPVMADVGCRNTVFGAEAQVASRHMDALAASGIRHFRLEFVHETAGQVKQVAAAFTEYGAGKLTARALDQRLRALVREGTTQGSLFVPDDYLRVPVLE